MTEPSRPDDDSTAVPPTRRDAITWIAVGGLTVGGLGALAAACTASTSSTPSTTTSAGSSAATGSTVTGVACVLTPEMTEGPYYVDDPLDRRDITEGRPGAALALVLTVADATTCEPIADALVDVWHCDAGGIYSGFVDNSVAGNVGGGGGAPPGGGGPGGGGPGGAPPGGGGPGGGGAGGGGGGATDDTRFLRGIQRTDASGVARFDTIYPGWYQGRTVHIHVKVHLGDAVVHTGQLFFDEAQTDAVYAKAPYSSHTGTRLKNSDDSIYRGGGSQSIVAVSLAGNGRAPESGQTDGYTGTLTMGVKRSAAAAVQ